MAITLQRAEELSQQTTKQLTGNREEWLAFLHAAGNLYKYSFSDQMMIYAQRPDATAAASYETWNKLGRYIQRGSKGIALFRPDGNGLKYVFDVSDTAHGRGKSKEVLPPWRMGKRHIESVFARLESEYNVPDIDGDYPARLQAVVSAAVNESLTGIMERVEQEMGSANLSDLDDLNRNAATRRIVSNSVSYMVFARMGVNPEIYLDADDFADLWNFNSPEMLSVLGEAVNDIASPILREVEQEVKRIDRETMRENPQKNLAKEDEQVYNKFNALNRENERGSIDELHSERRLPVPSIDDGRSTGRDREIRQDAAQVFTGAPERQAQRSAIDWETESSLAGGQPDHQKSDRTDGSGNAGKQSRTGQGNRPDGLGATPEPADRPGGGNDLAGDGLQVSFADFLPNIPSPEKQIQSIQGVEGITPPASFALSERIMSSGEIRQSRQGTLQIPEYQYMKGDIVYIQQHPYIISRLSDWHAGLTAQDSAVSPSTFDMTLVCLERSMYLDPRNDHRQGELRQYKLSDDPITAYTDGQRFILNETANRFEPKGYIPEKKKQLITPTQTSSSRHERQAPTAGNFRITDPHLGEGGEKAKYAANIAAIRTLKQIEAENRHATKEEQEILHRYVGWGGIPNAFDADKPKWAAEYTELKELLTEEEYRAARRSTLNAHYTSPVVISAIYKGLHNLGFRKGNLLEPALGVGNFFGMLPESMQDSKLYGVELDSITGRIAKELYPTANIQVKGFQDAEYPDAFFDCAIGNVPFGNFSVADKRYDKQKFHIHDYFFAKTLDKVRPGGVIAFVTSNGTLDKQDASVRKYLAQRGELLGAIRLPNDAFKKNAGTEVTTDIIFLKKRDRILDIEPDWVQLGETEDGIPVNQYFAEHPEMVLGKMVYDKSMYGDDKDTACHAIEGADLAEQLKAAVGGIQGQIEEYTLDDVEDLEQELETIPADLEVRNHSYTIVDGQLYFRENSIMVPIQMNSTAEQRAIGMIAVRDAARKVIDFQLNGYGDSEIHQAQVELNRAYDSYTKKYGLLNSRANRLAFDEDSSYPLLCSLENLDKDGTLKSKADMFSKRTIKAYQPITHVDTAQEALAVSLSEKACVDIGFMSSLMGGDKLDTIIQDLHGIIFKDPSSDPADLWNGWQNADEYLSGNVRQKLEQAKKAAQEHPQYAVNVDALERVQPKELTATEIELRMGTTWIPDSDYTDFIHELLGVPESHKDDFTVNYVPALNEYRVHGKRLPAIDTALNNTYGTKRVDAITLLRRSLNLKSVRVFDTQVDQDGKEVKVLNKKETALAQNRQEKIKRAFRDWVWKDPERRERLCKYYNETYNNSRPREFDGSHLTFPGMNPEIKLQPHQKDAVARILYGGGNTLLAHVVGAGKTYTMIAAAMEKKRLGLVDKPLFAVPNHLTGQFGADILKLYPGANVLVATKKDFEPANRKKFCSRIATGNYDAVVIGHSQYERIPLSKERQIMCIEQEIDEITAGIEALKAEDAERYTIKQLERTRQSLEDRIKRLSDDSKKDEVVTFEQLGVDMLHVDEAHLFKNLYLYSKMQNIGGISSSASQRAMDMYWKTGYMDELTGGTGTVFATGTPVSNSMAELYTMQRYLMRKRLSELGLSHFDQWASIFGETQTAMELSPEGTGFRMKTRFSRFYNLPEVIGLFKEVADIKVAEQLNLPRPKANYHNVEIEPSEYQQEIVESFADRAEAVRDRKVEPREDNMLKITTDGRKVALDQRLSNPLLPDDPDSKVNTCANKVFEIFRETTDKKAAQLVFCDLSTPKDRIEMVELEDGTFGYDPTLFTDVYNDLRNKLVDKGIDYKEIAFIHEAKTDKQKEDLFAKVRSGEVRVLIGSTPKMGAGTNVQDRLIALHHLDVPWKPSDIEQQEGRILRQGNQNDEVDIYRYVTKGTFDAYSWQIIENKQKFIGQIMTGKNPARSMDDIDATALDFAEVKALATGDPRIKEKMDLDVQIANLRLLKSDYLSQRYQFEDALAKRIPQQIQTAKIAKRNLEQAQQSLAAHPVVAEHFSMEIGRNRYTERKDAGAAIIKLCQAANRPDGVIGTYRGFEMRIKFDELHKQFKMELKNGSILSTEISGDAVGTVARIINALDRVPQLLEQNRENIAALQQQKETIGEELKKPFPHDTELEQKEERMNILLQELAEAEKERSAKRKLAKGTAQAEQPQTGKSISGFLKDYKPPALSSADKTEKTQEHSYEISR